MELGFEKNSVLSWDTVCFNSVTLLFKLKNKLFQHIYFCTFKKQLIGKCMNFLFLLELSYI